MKKCWAKSLGNCSTEYSNEHLVSKGILADMVTVQGFSWCKDRPVTISKTKFASHILCKRHNELLSPLDDEILNFVKTFEMYFRNTDKFTKYGFSLKKVPVQYEINGNLLERWFCKTLLNISYVNEKEVEIPIEALLPYLYSNKEFENPFGLHFAIQLDMEIESNNDKINIEPLLKITENGTKKLAGGLFIFRGFYFIFLIPSEENPIKDNKLAILEDNKEWEGLQLNWHNQEISGHHTRGQKKILTQFITFQWNKSILGDLNWEMGVFSDSTTFHH